MLFRSSKAARVTWQASQKNKFSFFADVADDCLCRAIGALGSAPEAGLAFHFRPTGLYQGDWTSPITSKLLTESNAYALFRQPQVILLARFVKMSLQFDF